MNIFPAIDLYDKKAVRLLRGEFDKMTVYSDNPPEFAREFERKGAKFLHLVDLEGAKTGKTPNIDIIRSIISSTSLKVEIGGGIRSESVIKQYLDAGAMRVILGTAAVTDPDFLHGAIAHYGERIAVGVDIKDGKVAIRGWVEKTELDCFDFFKSLSSIGVKTVICTDISKDGLLAGTNLSLYRSLSERFSMDIVASGGVTSVEDIKALKSMNIYGAILGKALYTGALKLEDALAAGGAD